jgi:fimbrial chaperone protein
LVIGPVVVEFGPGQRVAAVTVRLDDSVRQPVRLQAEVLRWRQDLSGASISTETDEMLVTPPVADLRPGQRQVFRLALRGPRPAPEELAYRLVLEDISEVPAAMADPATAAQADPQAMAINFRLRYDLPVMVAPLGAVTHLLRWKTCPATATSHCLRLFNAGNRRVKLTTLTLAGDGGEQTQSLGDGEVLLVGSEREWRLQASGALRPDALRGLKVQTSRGEVIEAQPGGF